MQREQIEQAIQSKLKERQKHIVNRNAFSALLAALGLGPLGKIFLGRLDVLADERLRIQEEIVLDLLCRIDDAISSARAEASRQRIDWNIISGEIEAHGVDADEITGARIRSDAGPTELKPGTHIRASGERTRRVTGLDIGGQPNNREEGE